MHGISGMTGRRREGNEARPRGEGDAEGEARVRVAARPHLISAQLLIKFILYISYIYILYIRIYM